MMKKIEDAGFRIVEVPVHHFHRAFGKSQFFNFRRIAKTGRRRAEPLGTSWSIRRQHLRPGVRPLAATARSLPSRVYPDARRDRERRTTASSTAAAP